MSAGKIAGTLLPRRGEGHESASVGTAAAVGAEVGLKPRQLAELWRGAGPESPGAA